jgi:hypothetical protein
VQLHTESKKNGVPNLEERMSRDKPVLRAIKVLSLVARHPT